jgi:hypothetical protein
MADRFVLLPGTPTYNTTNEAFAASDIGDVVRVGPGFQADMQHTMVKAVDLVGAYLDGYPVRPFADPALLPHVDSVGNFIPHTQDNQYLGSPLHMWDLPSLHFSNYSAPTLILSLNSDTEWGAKDTVTVQDIVMFGSLYSSSSANDGEVLQVIAYPTTTKTVRFANCVFVASGYSDLYTLDLDINDNVKVVFDNCLFLVTAVDGTGSVYEWFGADLSETQQQNIYFNRCEVRKRSTINPIDTNLPYQQPENLDIVYTPTPGYGWEHCPFYPTDLYSIFGTITDIPDFVTGDDFKVYLFEERDPLGSNEIKFPEIGSSTLDVSGNWSFTYLPRDKRYGVLIQPPDGMQGHWLRWYNPVLQ